MKSEFGMELLTSDVVFCCAAPWSTLCGLVNPGRLLCVSINCYGVSIVWCRYFFVGVLVVVGVMDCIVDMHNHY
jgi:hypothetical protein